MVTTIIAVFLLALFVGAGIGYYFRVLAARGQEGRAEMKAEEIIIQAKKDAQTILEENKKEIKEKEQELKIKEESHQHELKDTEKRLIKKEEFLDTRQQEINKEVEKIKEKIEEIKTIKERVDQAHNQKTKEIESISKLSQEEAKDLLMTEVKKLYEEDLLIRTQKLEMDNQEKLDRRAKDILSTAIQRLASSTAGEIMTTSLQLPNEEIKGKIIGKEGRNIKTFERIAGVELIVDETPGTIIISSFDPVRRQTAKIALENLIMDGRIQPAKIEEMIEKAKEDINKIIKQKGEEAVYECGIYNLDSRITMIIGRLYFRTSYGQNVLQHSIEMAHISGMLAEELGADIHIAKAGALVHDIGKALDHEIQGTHIDIGIRILQKFGADPKIITAMKSHHDDCPHETIEAVIVQTADIISGGRPGARRDSVENYLKRLQDLESLVTTFKGVEKAFALSAGREIRIFVTPSQVNDFEAKTLARDIAQKVQNDLKYPGEIKITVIRETRIIDFAR